MKFGNKGGALMNIDRIKLFFCIGIGIITANAYLISREFSAVLLCVGVAIVLGVFLRILIDIYEELRK